MNNCVRAMGKFLEVATSWDTGSLPYPTVLDSPSCCLSPACGECEETYIYGHVRCKALLAEPWWVGWGTVYKLSCCQAVTAHVGAFAVTPSVPHGSSSGLPLLPVSCVPPLHGHLVIRFSQHVFVPSVTVLLHQSPFSSVLYPLSRVSVLTSCFTTKVVLFYFIGDGHRNCFSVYVKRQIAFVFLVQSESPVGVPSAACLSSWERTLLFWLFEPICNFVLAHRCDCDMWGLCPLPLRPLFLSFSEEILGLFLNKQTKKMFSLTRTGGTSLRLLFYFKCLLFEYTWSFTEKEKQR